MQIRDEHSTNTHSVSLLLVLGVVLWNFQCMPPVIWMVMDVFSTFLISTIGEKFITVLVAGNLAIYPFGG